MSIPPAGVGQAPSVPLRAKAPVPAAVKDGAWTIPRLSNQLVLTLLMFKSNRSAAGVAGVVRAKGNPGGRAEGRVKAGFMASNEPGKEGEIPKFPTGAQ